MHLLLLMGANAAQQRAAQQLAEKVLGAARTLQKELGGGELAAWVWAERHVPMRLYQQDTSWGCDLGLVVGEGAEPGQWLAGEGPYPDGYFLSVCRRPDGLRIGCDRLGLMPLWYAVCGQQLMVSTHLGLLRRVTGVAQTDHEAVLSAMVFGHPLNNRSLWDGLRRLPAGEVLHRGVEGAVRLQRLYRLQPRENPSLLPELLEAMQTTLSEGMARALSPFPSCWLALSGGRDSRLLAGLLSKGSRQVRALTFGLAGESDFECAKRVAATLDLPLEVNDLDPAGGEAALRAFIDETQASSGLPGTGFHGLPDSLRNVSPVMVTGYLFDAVAGGSHMAWSSDRSGGVSGFDCLLTRLNRWGMALPELESVLTPGGREQLRTILQSTQQAYQELAEDHARRAWLFDLQNRQRHYIGIIPKILSEHLWPLIPATDEKFLALCASVPPALLADRHLQDEWLRRKWPALAKLPLDRATDSLRPLAPDLRWELQESVGRHLSRWLPRKKPDLFYARVLSVNTPAWRAIRQRAEQTGYEALPDCFDPAAVRALMPAGNADLRGPHPVLGWEWVKRLASLAVIHADLSAPTTAPEV